MSYTRHTWTDPETITAAKLNNIEDGIEEAAQSGGGGFHVIDGVLYFPNSAVGMQIYGDFATALSKAQQGIPVIVAEAAYESSSGYLKARLSDQWYWVEYDSEYPNRLDIQITGGMGFYWTASGLVRYGD